MQSDCQGFVGAFDVWKNSVKEVVWHQQGPGFGFQPEPSLWLHRALGNMKLEQLLGRDGRSAQWGLLPACLLKQDCSPVWFPSARPGWEGSRRIFLISKCFCSSESQTLTYLLSFGFLSQGQMDSSVCCSKLSSLLRSPFVMRDVILCCCRLRESTLHVEWKGLISLALSALSLPLWLGFNHLCHLSVWEAGRGDGG